MLFEVQPSDSFLHNLVTLENLVLRLVVIKVDVSRRIHLFNRLRHDVRPCRLDQQADRRFIHRLLHQDVQCRAENCGDEDAEDAPLPLSYDADVITQVGLFANRNNPFVT